MRIGDIDLNERIMIIAEIGNNHEGDLSLAKEMIVLAANAGVDAVKFQTIVPEKLVSSSDETRIQQLKGFQLSYDQYEELAAYCKEQNVQFLSTPFDIESAEFLSKLVPAYKIASSDNTFYALLDCVCATGIPIIMSTGMSNINELDTSVRFIEESWKKHYKQGELALLHCITNYPTEPSDANLRSIAFLKDYFDYTIGYSDHTLGNDAAIAAAVLGAQIIEKHFTIDHNHSDFRDHQLSADPQEMKELVEGIRKIEVLRGDYKLPVNDKEMEISKAARRSIAASKDLATGTVITESDITWLRPGTGILAGQEEKVIGRELKKDLKMGDLITEEDLN